MSSSEIRKDPITGEQIIIAEERSARPGAFVTSEESQLSSIDSCPFCKGNEWQTPTQLAVISDHDNNSDQENWRIRVIPNKYPAVENQETTLSTEHRVSSDLFNTFPGNGLHEVVVDAPNHVLSITDVTIEHLAKVFWIYRERLLIHKETPQILYSQIFKNVGALAGASLEHTHSQILGLPLVPKQIWQEISGGLEYYSRNGRCVLCDLIFQELHQTRFVYQNSKFLAFTAFAGKFPYETWIVPKQHSSNYENLTLEDSLELAETIQRVVQGLETIVERLPYNYMIYTSPLNQSALNHYHWHVKLTPRITKLAGFELATGMFVNPMSPEKAASQLKEVIPY